MGIVSSINEAGAPLMGALSALFHGDGAFPVYFTAVARWVFVILALFVLIRAIRSLLSVSRGGRGRPAMPRNDTTTSSVRRWFGAE